MLAPEHLHIKLSFVMMREKDVFFKGKRFKTIIFFFNWDSIKKIDNLKNYFLQILKYRPHILYTYSGILFSSRKTDKHLGFAQEKSITVENFSNRLRY